MSPIIKRMVVIALCVMALAFTFGSAKSSAQECPGTKWPRTASKARALDGLLIYHDGIRKWYELKLDAPTCQQHSLQLVRSDSRYGTLEALRGCRVRSTGSIDYSTTGYYSLDQFQEVTRIEPIGTCARKPPLPDYSHARPSPRVRSYTVYMHVDYRAGDHPIMFDVRSTGRELRPWQAYADYMLTGSFVLYGTCGTGFAVEKVFGPRVAKPSHFGEPGESDDRAAFDPETAAASGKTDLRLGYTCVRRREDSH